MRFFLSLITIAVIIMFLLGPINDSAQCWLYVGGMCWFAYGMIRLDAVFNGGKK